MGVAVAAAENHGRAPAKGGGRLQRRERVWRRNSMRRRVNVSLTLYTGKAEAEMLIYCKQLRNPL